MKGNFIMEETDNILPQKSKTLVKYIFDWRFILEVAIAVALRILYSVFSSNMGSILYAKMLSSSTADVLMMFFDFLFIALTLAVLFFIEKKETRRNLYLTLSILILFAALNGASNWLTVGATQIFKNFLGYARVFTNLSFVDLFIIAAQVVKISENKKSFYGLLLMNYVLIILGLFVANPIIIRLAQNANGQYLASFVYFFEAVVVYFFFAYIPYFLSVDDFWKGVYHGFICSFKKFFTTLVLSVSAAFIIYFLLGKLMIVGGNVAQGYWYLVIFSAIYFLNLFALAVFFVITTYIGKAEFGKIVSEEVEINEIEEDG